MKNHPEVVFLLHAKCHFEAAIVVCLIICQFWTLAAEFVVDELYIESNIEENVMLIAGLACDMKLMNCVE